MEVYGVKPKMFTKEWWGYFWYYYKWHTLGGAFAAFLIITSCVQCATQTKYDLQIDFISEYGLLQETEDALTAIVAENIEDVTQNGVNEAFVLSLNMGETQDVQMMQAMQTKLMIEMGYSEGYVFIMTKQYADMITENEVLEKTEVWAGDKANDGYVISLANNKALANIGIDAAGQDLYIGVLKMKDDQKEEELACARYQNGIKFAQYLVSQE